MNVSRITRRTMLRAGTVAAAAGAAGNWPAFAAETRLSVSSKPAQFKIGLVTYRIAAEWDLPTILQHCKTTGYEAIELRTTHKHGVEPTIDGARRREVCQQITDSGLTLWGLGTECQFHETDPAVVQRNIETCRRFCELARDLGAVGVKVRPNGLPKGIPVEKTLEQIGVALRQCGQAAADNGVEIWVEVHGPGTAHPPHMRTIIDLCDHPKVGVCWNSNSQDVKDGSVREYFNLLRPKLLSCHINELASDYPWRELFTLLRETGYDRYTLQEIQPLKSTDPEDAIRLMRYYRALWQELCRP